MTLKHGARVKADTIRKLNGARAAGDLSRITIASFDKHPEYSGKTMAEVTIMNGDATDHRKRRRGRR